MKAVGVGRFHGWRFEGTVWELAGWAQNLETGKEIMFSPNTEDADTWGEWCGIKKVNLFDNDNDIYLIGFYGGEGNVRMYQMSEYDPQVGDTYRELFCGSGMGLYPTDELKEQAVIARMIMKFADDFEGIPWEEVVWETSSRSGNRVISATACYTGGGVYTYTGQMLNGMYFMASDFCKGEAGCITFFNADPEEAGEDAFNSDWQDAHIVEEDPFLGNAAEEKEWWNKMITLIIESKPEGNYLAEELEERLVK